MTFRLYSIPVRCGNTRFRGQIRGDFSAILEGRAGMADSEGCERNPFAQDVFRPKVAYLQNVSEIEKISCSYRFGPLRHALLSFLQISHFFATPYHRLLAQSSDYLISAVIEVDFSELCKNNLACFAICREMSLSRFSKISEVVICIEIWRKLAAGVIFSADCECCYRIVST